MREPTYEIDVVDERGGISPVSFVMGVGAGFALGVIGTILFATYREEHFRKVVSKTREIGDSAQDTAGQLKDRMGDLTDAAKKQIKRAQGKLEAGIDDLKSGELVSN
jgi:uncharacterized protein YjbJ (UPF0337 family)